MARLGPVAHLDLRIDQHIAARDRTAALTTVAKAVSLAGGPVIGIALTVVLPLILVLLRRRRDAVVAFCMFAGALGLAEIAKLIINEHRPPLSLQAAGADLSPSYPSGHTTTAAIIAVTPDRDRRDGGRPCHRYRSRRPLCPGGRRQSRVPRLSLSRDLVGGFLCALAAAFITTGFAALPVVRGHLDCLSPESGYRR